MAEREPLEERPKFVGATRVDPHAVVRTGLREPVVVILLLAGFFDGISGNPVHALVLGAAAVALAADAAGQWRWAGWRDSIQPVVVDGQDQAQSPAQRSWLGVVFAVCVLGFAAVAGGFARYSWPATLAIVVPSAAVLVVAWRGPLPGAPEPVKPSTAGSVIWSTAFVILSLWELAMLFMQPTLTTDSQIHPTLSTLMDPVLVSHPGRTIALCAWAGAGWFLVRL